MQGLPGKIEATLYFYLNKAFADSSDSKERYGRFLLKEYNSNDDTPFIAVQDNESQETFTFSVLPASTDCTGINLYISESNNKNHPIERFRITNTNIPDRMIDETLIWIDNAMTKIKFNELINLSKHMKHFSSLVKNSKYTPMETLLLENLGLTLKLIKCLFLGHLDLNPTERLETIGSMIDFVRKFGRDSDLKAISLVLSDYLLILGTQINSSELDEIVATDIVTTLKLARSHGFEPETKKLQDSIYPYYTEERKTEVDSSILKEMFSVLNFK